MADLTAWTEALRPSLVAQLRAALTRVAEEVAPEEVVGLGIYTDADAVSIVAALNTRANLSALTAGADRSLAAYYRWSVAEWDRTTLDVMDAGGPDDLAELTGEIERMAAEVEIGELRPAMWGLLVESMHDLAAAGFFDAWPEAVRVFNVPGNEPDPSVQRERIGRLNTAGVLADYDAYLADQPT